jgi:TusA-related sulfurtransferase
MAYIDMDIDTTNPVTRNPIISALRAMDKLLPGQVLKITTNSAGVVGQFERVCQQLGYQLLEMIDFEDEYTLLVKKATRH